MKQFFFSKKNKWIFEEHQNKGKIKPEEFVFQNTIREIWRFLFISFLNRKNSNILALDKRNIKIHINGILLNLFFYPEKYLHSNFVLTLFVVFFYLCLNDMFE